MMLVLNNSQMMVHCAQLAGTVAENCTREWIRSNLRESKIQKFPGGHAPRPT